MPFLSSGSVDFNDLSNLAAGSAARDRSVVARDWFALCSLTFQSCATPKVLASAHL
jgi:hypothetical protein